MLRNRGEIIELARLEIGKLEVEALFSEALGPLDQVSAWGKRVLTVDDPANAEIIALGAKTGVERGAA